MTLAPLAGNSDLFVQVIAHIAAAAVPSSALQYLKAGQITPLAKPTGGHRPLLMMSFLRRLALKSVMAAKKESVAKCAGPLQYGVGRPDGANTMIKTIQYLAEADNSRFLVALDLKAAFQNVSRRAMLYSIAQTDADLAAVFSKWYTGTTEHRMHYDSAYTKISVLCQRVDSQQLLTLYSVQSWRALHALRLRRQTLCLPGPLVPVDQTAMPPTDNCCYHNSHQISQSCSTVHQDTSVERLLPGSHSTWVPRQGHAHTQLFGRTPTNTRRH